jgi:hypothetical protein
MDRIEAYFQRIPGYSGYRDKENRRDSDRRLRESIAGQLESIARRVERGGARLIAARQLDQAGGVEQLVRSLDHAANLVRTQSYGYGGIFSDRSIDERALNQLSLFDKGLALKVEQLDAQLSGIESAVSSGGNLTETLGSAETAIRSIVDLISTRGEVLETAAVAPSRSLFEPLDEAAAAPPLPAIEVGIGDAISWFDDDYLVDSLIDIRDGDRRIRLLHVGRDPDRWVVIAEHGERLLAMLQEDPHSSAGIPADQRVAWHIAGPGRTVNTTGETLKADAAVTAYASESAPDQVALRVLSGADERYLTGTRIHPDDLAIYGQPAKS